MKKLLLFPVIFFFAISLTNAQTTAICSTFDNATGLSEYDPNDKITFSVANNELTIVFSDAVVWGSANEVKIDFPSLLNLSAASTTNIVSFDVKVVGALTVTGGGCNPGVNYVPLGFSFYDNSDIYTPGFSTATGIYDANYATFTASSSGWGSASSSSVKGISIKPADPGANCVSGTSVVNGTLVIKNFKINNGTCATTATPTSFCGNFANTTGLSEYDPNNKLDYSVASNELTLNLSGAVIYGSNELKIDFPSGLDLSTASSTGLITFDVKVSSAISVTGGGCSPGTNFIPLAFSFYDNSGDTYANGSSTASGVFDETQFVRFTVDGNLTGTGFDNSAVKGIAIKPGDPGSSCTSGTSEVTGTLLIKNFGINSSSCGGTSTSVNSNKGIISTSKLYPNPVSDVARLEMTLKSVSNVKVTLSDLMGKEIMTVTEGTMSSIDALVDVSNLKKGAYSVNYYINGSVAKSELLMVK